MATSNNNLTNSNSSLKNSAWTTTYTSPSIGINTIGVGLNSDSNYYTYNDLLNVGDYTDLSLKTLLSCLPENKIDEIVCIAKINAPDDIFKGLIKTIVTCRHFSEDFLLKYIDYLDKESIYKKHSENVCSREYHSLALLLEERDKE